MSRLGIASSVTLATIVTLLGGPAALAREPVREQSFSMVAVTWRGPATPDVQVRTRDADGWGRWTDLHPLSDGPADSAAEATGVHGTELRWVGPSDAAQVRTDGPAPPGLDLVLIDPGTRASDRTATPVAAREARTARKATDGVPKPELLSRAAWGADNSLRNGSPAYGSSLKQVHVHHTVTGNDYARADVPALIRGMYEYHTRSLGWFDLGYNFLVDRFGRAWVGRSGGAGRKVQGAHTLGFNHSSVGIAVIGNHEEGAVRGRVLTTIAAIAAWKLDKAGRPRATGNVTVTSKGSDRFPAGQRVRLPVVDGHRDTNETACPGTLLYDRLDEVRAKTQKRMARYR